MLLSCRNRASVGLAAGVVWLSGISGVVCAEPTAAELEFFEKQVRPILVARCLKCHGGDDELQGGLRLDSMEAWLAGGDTGPALVAGKPDESLLIAAVRYEHDYLEMPPDGKLPDAEIAVLEDWVRCGAAGPTGVEAQRPKQTGLSIEEGRKFWSYRPLAAPAIPAGAEHPIDALVLAKLQAVELKPNPPADRATLARRLYFDLHGLPPTIEQLDAFFNDQRPDAYQRLVEQLLASPHFGERWGRHWLDVARFGESLTLRGFVLPEAWRYRDYVIEAFNADLPFYQFVREQIAGDLLAADDVEVRQRQIIATTFLTLGNTNLEEQDKRQLDMDVVDEQLDTLGKAILGQTIGCARCHDHKFDPIPTRDYYALAGILQNAQILDHANVSQWKQVPLPLPPEQSQQLAAQQAQVAALQLQAKEIKATVAALDSGGSIAEFSRPQVLPVAQLPGIVVDDSQAKQVGQWQASQWSKRYVGAGYLHDIDQQKGEKSLTFTAELPHDGLYEVRFAYTASGNRATNVPITVFSADGEKTIKVNQQVPPTVDGYFISLGEYRFEEAGQCFVLVGTQNTNGHVIADAVQFLPVDSSPSTDRTQPLKSKNDQLARERAKLAQVESRIKLLQQSLAERPQAMSVVERSKIDDCPVHIRGSVHALGEVVPRGFLQVVLLDKSPSPALPSGQSGRVELADWLTNADNPLASRVYVNRCWHWLFGAGLVRTTDNFGTTGELPSHPELLDHLAVQFVESGWSVKQLVRTIVLSQTYRQASTTADIGIQRDPENRWLWRMNRKRLEAECLRDAMLLVANRLDMQRGGPSFPRGLATDYGFRSETLPRRSVYLPVFRNALPEIFEAFDFADPSMVVGVRNVSTVAPQALFLMNHSFVKQCAVDASRKLLSEPGDDRARLDRAFRRILGRQPLPEEAELSLKFLASAGHNQLAAETAWAELVHGLFASLDFRYRD
jgi:hypothetical protein